MKHERKNLAGKLFRASKITYPTATTGILRSTTASDALHYSASMSICTNFSRFDSSELAYRLA